VAGILLIEDDAAARHLLRTLLERDAHTVWEAASVDDAWKVLEEAAIPELAIIDLRLGEANGIDFIRRMRSDPIWGALPVVLCSATPDRDSVLHSVQLGAAGFLTKPYDTQRIRAAVGKALSTKWVRKHFEDPVSVTRRLTTDRDHLGQQTKKFFAELQGMQHLVLETEEERKTASAHAVALQRSAAEFGMISLSQAFSEWMTAGISETTMPALVKRGAVVARIYNGLGV
jgi:CheY-like chemotaxis protein